MTLNFKNDARAIIDFLQLFELKSTLGKKVGNHLQAHFLGMLRLPLELPKFLKLGALESPKWKFLPKPKPAPRLDSRCDRRRIEAQQNVDIARQIQYIQCIQVIPEFHFHPT